ncbi:MAG: HD domain-containing protein, partial [Heliobacteriaceae bacterium]|nr:HD domain-containing protein [Heliobacteriaceae bacterium]
MRDVLVELVPARVWDRFQKKQAEIVPGWFFRPYGIHGHAHTKRVLLLLLILADIVGLDEPDTIILETVALYHDIGRDHDGVDPGHGGLSYAKAVKDRLLPGTGPQDQALVRFIMENHCVDDAKASRRVARYGIKDKAKALRLFNIFKDADGLDRVRINDLDVNQLRTAAAKGLAGLAQELL